MSTPEQAILQKARRQILEQNQATKEKAAGRTRLTSIDFLRGLVMIVMALDHTRDFFAAGGFNPRDVTEPALFLTRWITHFCAPTFIFLAGISAFLYGTERKTTEVSRYLFTRGCWLVLIEFTIVRFGWTFSFKIDYLVIQVIFAIGASMITLAALVHLPLWAIATFGLALIAGHDLFDGIKAEQFGAAAPLWNLLHQPGAFDLTRGFKLIVLYPLIPWIGVMAAGYALGPLFRLKRETRVRQLFAIGALITVGFVFLRATNLYGDPAPWAVQNGVVATTLSFIELRKISSVVAFSGDDARTCAYASRGVRRSAGNHRGLDYDIRSRAVVLLHCSHLSAARLRHLDRTGHNRG